MQHLESEIQRRNHNHRSQQYRLYLKLQFFKKKKSAIPRGLKT